LLWSFQIIHPSLRPCETFCNMLVFLQWGVVSPQSNPQAQEPPLSRLSVTAHSIYSQLPSISGGLLLHPQPKDVSCC
jgi:hypothetical protein